ncbi:transglycosylase SLT domain-containing protein [Rhizobium sp. 18065]|uniref:transglycosylase SLT domain-containing protein n=1 Tax=Rhizobium sp. 18065 TaxID=2681411 RepID=UPI00135C08B2|nr:transglycosylase SLT domain-containing protein [Rhizobium sp. 18065]
MRTAVVSAIGVMLMLSACAKPPSQTRNACAIFEQRDGLFNNWRSAAQKAEREYGVPVPILMATIYTESSFRATARPPRKKLLGFIPWKRQSSAYGYSQALDGTWERYQRETGRWGARRTDFGDAMQFIGWYHRESASKTGIPLNDPYKLYLAYHSGQAGYLRGAYKNRPEALNGAKRFTSITYTYASQLKQCPD